MIEYILSFVLGLIIGSFINCIVYRVYNNKSFFKGRSECPKCGHKLEVLDLIPLISFLSLKGKCRYCNKEISKEYPLVELCTGFLFLGVSYFLNASFLTQGFLTLDFLNLLFCFFITTCFILIFVFDYKWLIIPDGVTFTGIGVTLIYLFSNTFILNAMTLDELLVRVLTSFIVFLFFFALYFFSDKKAMGFGDVKLVILLGLLLGFPNIIPALFLAFALGAVIGLLSMKFKKLGLKSEIPFGPFLVVGAFIALFFGNYLVEWYLNLT
ncbi:MAG: prepilin peptidase [Candidatus Paceibacterota bacterium]